jgi:hypothetical protein
MRDTYEACITFLKPYSKTLLLLSMMKRAAKVPSMPSKNKDSNAVSSKPRATLLSADLGPVPQSVDCSTDLSPEELDTLLFSSLTDLDPNFFDANVIATISKYVDIE